VTWVQLGKASIGLGDYAGAVGYLQEAARINPFDPEVHRELARAYVKLGRVAEAERARNDESLVN
jgi:Flp pilus assembly protein TadD